MSSQVRPRGQRTTELRISTARAFLEFRKHKGVTNPVYVMGFLTQWKMYLDQLPACSNGHSYKGKKLDPTVFEKVCVMQGSTMGTDNPL